MALQVLVEDVLQRDSNTDIVCVFPNFLAEVRQYMMGEQVHDHRQRDVTIQGTLE